MASDPMLAQQYTMGALIKGHKLDLIPFSAEPMGENEVFVDILFCGMCHSDLHKVCDDWKDFNKYPMVPGHEVVGIVKCAGQKVKHLKVGDRVGFGPQRECCHTCGPCTEKAENVCPSFVGLYDPRFGGYATCITVCADFAFLIPDAIPSEVAGPLLCAGVTTFAPLSRYAKSGDKVGIVGIGGLGHMGLQYARALGFDTWAISTSAGKEAEARKFGAAHYLISSDATAMAAQKGTFDFILCTAASNFDVGAYLALLKPRRSFCLVGLPAVSTPLQFKPFDIIDFEKSIVGSKIGGIAAVKEMLEFSAAHKCFPQVEVIPLEAANEGFKSIEANTARYRVVLKIEGFRDKMALAAK